MPDTRVLPTLPLSGISQYSTNYTWQCEAWPYNHGASQINTSLTNMAAAQAKEKGLSSRTTPTNRTKEHVAAASYNCSGGKKCNIKGHAQQRLRVHSHCTFISNNNSIELRMEWCTAHWDRPYYHIILLIWTCPCTIIHESFETNVDFLLDRGVSP